MSWPRLAPNTLVPGVAVEPRTTVILYLARALSRPPYTELSALLKVYRPHLWTNIRRVAQEAAAFLQCHLVAPPGLGLPSLWGQQGE